MEYFINFVVIPFSIGCFIGMFLVLLGIGSNRK